MSDRDHNELESKLKEHLSDFKEYSRDRDKKDSAYRKEIRMELSDIRKIVSDLKLSEATHFTEVVNIKKTVDEVKKTSRQVVVVLLTGLVSLLVVIAAWYMFGVRT